LFTGIVEDLGEVEAVEHLGDFARIHVRSTVVTEDARAGDSICVNGVCLTVTGLITSRPTPAGTPPEPPERTPLGFTADVMGETLRHSSLKSVAPGTKVNLERSVRLADRLGGHLVQGHTDGTGTIVSRDPQGSRPMAESAIASGANPAIPPGGTTPRTPRGENWEVVRISLPEDLARYVVYKGSITVDGISLTVSAIAADWFEVSLIPETLKRTTLGIKQPGAEVNLEVDVVAKYVEKLMGAPGDR
jgi:riboflavin synthase